MYNPYLSHTIMEKEKESNAIFSTLYLPLNSSQSQFLPIVLFHRRHRFSLRRQRRSRDLRLPRLGGLQLCRWERRVVVRLILGTEALHRWLIPWVGESVAM